MQQSKAVAPAHNSSAVPTRAAYYVLTVFTLINLLNYVDRFVLAALTVYFKPELGLNDFELGWIASAFTIFYTVLSPVFGRLGDRRTRHTLVAIGIAMWSAATAIAGIAQNFWQLLTSRSVVGVGEASYATIAPGLLSDFFSKERRGTAMAVFFAALPLGQAAGFLAGGILGAPTSIGWRWTFALVSLPGLLLALAASLMREPQRGIFDEPATEAEKQLSIRGTYLALIRNRPFVYACLGYSALTFALGALAFWAPLLLTEDKGVAKDTANIELGIFVTLGGVVGTLAGGWVGDWLLKYTKQAYFLVCSISIAVAALPTFIALVAFAPRVYLPAIFISVFLMFIGNGPVNAILVNCVSPFLRSTAIALNILAIHILGDALSQPMVGWISTSLETDRHSLLGRAAALVASPLGLNVAQHHISVALLITPLAMLVSASFYFLGMRTLQKGNTDRPSLVSAF